MNGWHFTKESDGWRWNRLHGSGEPPMRSSRGFGSLLDCLNDAKVNGYSVVVASWRPQRLPGL